MMKAAARVNRPSATKAPPANSIAPANQCKVNNGSRACVGNPIMRELPCSKNSSATMMRTMDRT